MFAATILVLNFILFTKYKSWSNVVQYQILKQLFGLQAMINAWYFNSTFQFNDCIFLFLSEAWKWGLCHKNLSGCQPCQNAAIARHFRGIIWLHHQRMMWSHHSLTVEAENASETSDYFSILTRLAAERFLLHAVAVHVSSPIRCMFSREKCPLLNFVCRNTDFEMIIT
jgi:hypothetical protein